MGPTVIATAVLTLITGIGVFFLALNLLSGNLERLSGNRLKKLFAKTSKSKLLGVGIGTVATAAIQSSGAVSVMIIGFVNAGLMSLTQAATMIFGANIGTTITGQIVALGLLGGNTISTDIIFAAFAGIGASITLFAKKDRTKNIAGLLTGFGLLFVALTLMSSAMNGLKDLPQFTTFLASLQNPILLVVIGAIFTAIIQSSSVMTGIAITMLAAGLISLDQGIYLTLGSNIGSCVVAIIAGIGSSTNAKRTAIIHLLFNIFGVVLFLIADVIMRAATPDGVTFGSLLSTAFPGVPGTQLAMLHTFFNVATVIVILPFTKPFVLLVTKMIPERKRKPNPNDPRLFCIEQHMLKTPPIAVQQAKNEIVNMAEIAMRNFNLSLDTICSLDFAKKEQFVRDENELNFLNREIVSFIVKLSKTDLTEKDHVYLSTAYHSITDLERIGDYGENIMEYAEKLHSDNKGFSEDAIAEIKGLQELINDLYHKVMKAYVNQDLTSLKEAFALEDSIDDLTAQLSSHHIKRLDDGVCEPNVGAQYLSLTSNAERVADHFINVAKSILIYTKA
ncbi:MAG: Na/Pi cotransporter family protein, partial [Clostridia bacterium]